MRSTASAPLVIMYALAIAAVGCGAPPRLPADFIFGTAIAGFQAEMGCPTVPAAQCEDRNSDWYDYITKPELVGDKGLFIEGDPPSSGPGFYELYPEDLVRASQQMHNNGLRTSIEWSRLFPSATDGVESYEALRALASPAALSYYHALFSAMNQAGLRPFVTLDHYTLPSWIHDAAGCHRDLATCARRGWLDRTRVVTEIAKYAGFAAREFGAEVDTWATLNEPLTDIVLFGYLLPNAGRSNPPGVVLEIDAAKTVLVALIEAHARMYDAVKAADTVDADGDGRAARVGLVYNVQAVAPLDPASALDKAAAEHLHYLENQVFLDATAKGDLDANLDGQVVHRDDLAGRMDFIGINYYVRTVVEGAADSYLPALSPLLTFNPFTVTADSAYPRGIHETMKWVWERYQVPIVISETGSIDPDDVGNGSTWLVQSLGWVAQAAEEGVPIEGYFYWTLTDNYEWNHGMSIRAGLYAVDKDDPLKTRRARAPVALFDRIARAGQIPDDLVDKYPR